MSKQSEFLEKCYALDDEQVRAFYDEAAGDYDAILADAGYVSPQVCAQAFTDHFPQRDAALIDVGCGTGLLGEAMCELGFAPLVGVDFSAQMLAVAGARASYRAVSHGDLNRGLDIGDERYAGALSVGVMGQHVGPHALDEILRIVAPGGGVCFSINERAFESCGFRDRVEALHEQDVARCLSLTREPYHVNEGIEGWVCVLQKTAIA